MDEVSGGVRCHICEMMKRFARGSRMKGTGKGIGRDGVQVQHTKGKGKAIKSVGNKGSGKVGVVKRRSSRRSKRMEIPRAMLVVWPHRTQVSSMPTCDKEEES